jgi:hypothetical protein
MNKRINKNYSSIALFFFTFAILFSGKALAQTEIYGFAGYMTYSKIQAVEGDISFEDGLNYGGGVDVAIQRGMFVELNYTYNQTTARLRRFSGITETLFDMNTHYFQVGALYEMKKSPKQKAYPYGLITLGVALFDPIDPKYSDEWRFSVSFGGGGKINLSERVGLRLQGRILLPMTFSGGGMWCGTGGCSVGAAGWITLVQFDFTAGVFIRLGT